MEICSWSYTRNIFLITIKKYAQPSDYILFNGDINNEIPEYISKIVQPPSKLHNSGLYIEDDDNILQVINKIAITLKIPPSEIYLYSTDTGLNKLVKPLSYYYITKIGRPISIHRIPIVPNIFDFGLSEITKVSPEIFNDNQYDEKTRNLFIPNNASALIRIGINSQLVQSYSWQGTNNVITNICILTYADVMKVINHNKGINYDIKKQFINLYFPWYTAEKVDYSKLRGLIKKNEDDINTIYSKDDDPKILKTSPCEISEVVVHINYDDVGEDFIDQSKIFNRYILSHDVPFVKYKSEHSNIAQYRLDKDLTNEKSPIYIGKEDLETWIHTKVKTTHDAEKVIMSGKGLSYKILLFSIENYATGKQDRVYLTFNIFKSGKLEIKCGWQKRYPGKFEYIIAAIQKVRDVIREINKIDYQMEGKSRKIKIQEPDPYWFSNLYSNTKIAFYSINYNIKTKTDDFKLDKYINYLNNFDTFITKPTNTVENIKSSYLRYKRTNTYIKPDSINRFIHKRYTSNVSKPDIIKDLEMAFAFTYDYASSQLDKYIDIITKKKLKHEDKKLANYDGLYEDDGDGEEIDDDNIDLYTAKLFDEKDTGVSIALKKYAPSKIKVRLLGVSHDNIGQIYFFIKKSMQLFLQSEKGLIPDINIKKEKSKFGKKFIISDETDDDEDDDDDVVVEEKEIDPHVTMNDTESNALEESDASKESETNETGTSALTEPDYEDKEEPQSDNLLKRLKFSNEKLFYDDKYKNNSYSRKCQQDIKKPLVITSKKAREILAKQEKLLLKTENPEIKAELLKNIKLLKEEGKNIKGYFYFCPEKWDGTTYEPVTNESVNIIDKEKFNKLVFSNNSCQPCCVTKTISFKHKAMEQQCMNKFSGVRQVEDNYKPGITANINKYYILESAKRFVDVPDRYISLPALLNDIFNNKSNCKNQTSADVIFSCILRKSVSGPNYFFGALASAINRPVQYILDNIKNTLTGMPKNTLRNGELIFRSLKNGSLFNIFAPETTNRMAHKHIYPKILDAFLLFIQDNIETINEKFLWDLISMPGVLSKDGINLFILEGKYSINNLLTSVDIKCPTGYNLKSLYSNTKKTILLYKYENCYELLCNASYANKKITSESLFEGKSQITEQFIKSIRGCNPSVDNKARDEFKLFINNVTHATIIDKLFDLDNIIYDTEKIIGSIAKMNEKYPGVFEGYEIETQVVDSYNKVRNLVLKNKLCIPVFPSQINLNYEISFDNNCVALSYSEVMTKLLTLEKYAILPKLYPFSFMIDAHFKTVSGLLLRNGTSISIIPVPLEEVEYLVLDIKAPANYTNIIFDSSKLLFKVGDIINEVIIKEKDVMAQYKYYDEKTIDKLLQHDEKINDKRKIFTTRLNFEEETYERLRYQLSKYLQHDAGALKKLKNVIFEEVSIKNKRLQIKSIITNITSTFIITEKDLSNDIINEYEQLVGPLFFGFEEIENKDLSRYAFSYIIPMYRQECGVDNKKDGNSHCINNKLFIPSVNLNTGNKNNIENYLNRITEELLRNSIKRTEIFEDQINNSFDGIPYIDSEHHIIISDVDESITEGTKLNMIKMQIDNLYNKNISYDDKNNKSYDVINPSLSYNNIIETSTIVDDTNTCAGDYTLLPEYWQIKLKKTNYQYLKTKHDSCIFTLIKQAIESKYGQNKINDLKQYIISAISTKQDIKQEKGVKTVLWEEVRKGYAQLNVSYAVDTEEEFYETIKSNSHVLNNIDLSILSRVLDVKFIILSDPSKWFPSGIKCMMTTQTLSDNYILLFSNQFGDLHIIHDINGFVPTKIFSADMLKDEIFVEIWQETCSSDYKNYIEKFNQLFYGLSNISEINEHETGGIDVKLQTISYETAPDSDRDLSESSGDISEDEYSNH
jgi:hypothetical protein